MVPRVSIAVQRRDLVQHQMTQEEKEVIHDEAAKHLQAKSRKRGRVDLQLTKGEDEGRKHAIHLPISDVKIPPMIQ